MSKHKPAAAPAPEGESEADIVPTRAGEVMPHTPPGYEGLPKEKRPVYLIRVPRYFERQKFWRDLTALGFSFVADAAMHMIFDRALAQSGMAPDALTAAQRLVAAARAADGPLPDAQALLLLELEQAMRRVSPQYATAVANRHEYLQAQPAVAFQSFVVGWRNVDADYAQLDGKVDEAALAKIEPDDIIKVGNFIVARLFRPSKEQEKNFASPRPSAEAPTPSAAATTTQGEPSTAAPGK